MLAARTGAKLRFVPLTKDGTELDMAVRLQLFGICVHCKEMKETKETIAPGGCCQIVCHLVPVSACRND